MAAKGLFTVGFSVAEVLEIQAQAKKDVKAGRVITSYTSGGTSAGKAQTLPTDRVLEECKYALQVLDPDTYGRPRTSRRVSANFGTGSIDL